MKKHPLYEIFKDLQKGTSLEAIHPLPESCIVKDIAPSSHFEKMGCLILAGGQGTRLGFKGPKGCVILKNNKTLFEHFFEKVKKKGENLPVAIMTSFLNHSETMQYLEGAKYFGLKNVSVFSQEALPVCDDDGNLYDEIKAPDGNGRALKNLYESGIWEKWKKCGIEYVQVIPVDNPLAEPFDGEFLAIHEKEKVELVLKCIKRKSLEEKLGMVGQRDGKLMIREYSEITEQFDSNKFSFGNTGLFSCTMDFVKQAGEVELPWHIAHKQAGKRWIWKFETFIFDLFPSANSFKVILSERKKCFAPIKGLADLQTGIK